MTTSFCGISISSDCSVEPGDDARHLAIVRGPGGRPARRSGGRRRRPRAWPLGDRNAGGQRPPESALPGKSLALGAGITSSGARTASRDVLREWGAVFVFLQELEEAAQ